MEKRVRKNRQVEKKEKTKKRSNRKKGKSLKGKKAPNKTVKKGNKGNKRKRKRQQLRQKRLRSKKIRGYVRDFLVVCSVCFLLAVAISFFFFHVEKVTGYSMAPTLRNNETVIVKKDAEPQRFDLILFRIGSKVQIRRLIGFSGEEIRYEDDVLFVDEKPLDEKFIIDEINEAQENGGQYTEDFLLTDFWGEAEIEEGYYLVLGDNRPYATDSRSYGLIKAEDVMGVVTMKLFPFHELQVF